MASRCSDPTRNPINLSSLRVAQSSLRQSVNSLSKRSLREGSPTVTMDQGFIVYVSLNIHFSTQNFRFSNIRETIFNDFVFEKMDKSEVAVDNT